MFIPTLEVFKRPKTKFMRQIICKVFKIAVQQTAVEFKFLRLQNDAFLAQDQMKEVSMTME